MKKIIAGAFIFLLLAAGCDQFSGSEKQLTRAESLIEKGDYSTAAINLRTLVRKDSSNGAAQLLLARAQRLQGDFTSATSALEAAAKAGADAAQVAALRAEISLDQGKYQELLAALAAGSPLPTAQQQRLKARALLGLRQPVAALAIVDELLRTETSAADLFVLAAECHAILGRAALAKNAADQALAADPKSPRAWLVRSALQQASDPAQAGKALQNAIVFAPGKLSTAEQVAILIRSADAALASGDAEAAKAVHARLLELAPQSPLTVLVGAQIDLLQDRAADAVAGLQRLVQQAPDLSPVRAVLISALLASGSYELALHELSSGLGPQIDPKRIDAIRAQIKDAAAAKSGSDEQTLKTAAITMGLEQSTAATVILKQALKARPESVPLLIALQQLQQRAGQVRQALSAAQSLAQRMPAEPAVLMALAEAQSAAGDDAAAAGTYESVWQKQRSGALAVVLSQARVRSRGAEPLVPLTQWLADHSQDLVVRMALAASAQQLGQTAQATAEYERVVALQPQSAVALNNLAGLYQLQHDSRALAIAKRAYQLAGKLPAIADTYGWLLTEAGDSPAAVPILRSAVAGALASPEMRYHLAAALAQVEGDAGRKEAQTLLEDLLRDERPFPWRADAEKLLKSVSGGPA